MHRDRVVEQRDRPRDRRPRLPPAAQDGVIVAYGRAVESLHADRSALVGEWLEPGNADIAGHVADKIVEASIMVKRDLRCVSGLGQRGKNMAGLRRRRIEILGRLLAAT